MLAVDEPTEVGITPVERFFWWRGTRVVYRVSITTRRATNALNEYSPRLSGEFGRSWLADPCSAIIESHLNRAYASETTAQAADRVARREAKAKLQAEEREQKRQKPRRRAW